jgi:uncharacterized protein (DUF488 family)
MLQKAGVRLVVDVRSVPRSRTNPQYNFDVISGELHDWQIVYERVAELGGLRGRSQSVSPEVNGYWENRSFHNYADYALSDEFETGFAELADLAAQRPSVIMCAEAVWWRCHRRIIADYLLDRGWPVIHLMGEGKEQSAKITPAAQRRDGRLVYPVACVASEPPSSHYGHK